MAELFRDQSQPVPDVQRFRCGDPACDARIERTILMNLPVDQVVAQWGAITCPKCGGKKILMGENRRLSEDRADRAAAGITKHSPIFAREEWWRRHGEEGMSSRAVSAHMMGRVDHQAKWAHPHDLDDVRRIMLLLDLVPEWAGRMDEMAEHSPEWDAISKVWDPMATAFLRDRTDFRGTSDEASDLLETALASARP